jgi:hypothetical protein
MEPAEPPRFRTVNIVTYGRSGSTLLMGLLNAIDGYRIRGENFGCMEELRRFHGLLRDASEKQSPKTTSAWFNEFDPDQGLAELRELHRLLLNADGRARVFGFKEIRYVKMQREELFALLDFLELLAPPSAVIFNTRDVDAVRRSKWWSKMRRREVRRLVGDFERNMRDYCEQRPERCFHIDYDDVVGRTPRVSELLEFLGERLEPEVVEGVLRSRHSY